MTEIEKIRDYLENLNIYPKGEIVINSERPDELFISIETERDSEGKQKPTKKALIEIRDYFSKNGLSINFILQDSTTADLETGLRATLMLVFPNLRNVFCSITDNTASVWIEPKYQLSDEEHKEISSHADRFFQLVGIKLETIQSTRNENTPTKTAILSNIRIIAPTTLATLIQRLREKKFIVPSDEWLRRQLDGLRKGGAVVVAPDGQISLSLATLRSLGTKKTARSPDITRMLALARQQG